MTKPISFIALSALLVLPSLAVQAASECKGLDQTACGANPGCSWVSGYKRQDGKEVAAYCKSKGEKKTGEEAAAPAQAPAAPAKVPAASVPARPLRLRRPPRQPRYRLFRLRHPLPRLRHRLLPSRFPPLPAPAAPAEVPAAPTKAPTNHSGLPPLRHPPRTNFPAWLLPRRMAAKRPPL